MKVDIRHDYATASHYVDVIEPEMLEIVISYNSKVIWINGPNGCLFRACRIGELTVRDERKT